MAVGLNVMSPRPNTVSLLSGMHVQYTQEWAEINISMCQFVMQVLYDTNQTVHVCKAVFLHIRAIDQS